MIDKPDDVIPTKMVGTNGIEYVLRLSEVSQIASAYVDCLRAVDSGAYGAAEELDKWDNLFKEWSI